MARGCNSVVMRLRPAEGIVKYFTIYQKSLLLWAGNDWFELAEYGLPAGAAIVEASLGSHVDEGEPWALQCSHSPLHSLTHRQPLNLQTRSKIEAERKGQIVWHKEL